MNSPLHIISEELNKFSWDSDEELENLTRQHILNALKKYQQDEVNETEIEKWANLIEGREDIGRENSYESVINMVLNELANPLLTEPLTKERAIILSNKLK